jgi:HAD superfamily hydrolase (TIGR01490 family)
MNTTNDRVAFIDIDGTLLKGQSQLYFVKYLRERKKLSFVQNLLLISWFIFYKLGFVDSPKRALLYAINSFKGKSGMEVDSLAQDFFDKILRDKIYPKAGELIREIVESGHKPILVSAAIQPIVSAISKHFQVSDYICTQLEKNDGILTGRIDGNPVYGEEKISAVMKYCKEHDIDINSSEAFADHLSDKALLEKAGKAIAVNPTSGLYNLAVEKKWSIRYINE